jgi:hypothetical protein
VVEQKVTFVQLENAAASTDIVEKARLIVPLVVSHSMAPVLPNRLLLVLLLPVLRLLVRLLQAQPRRPAVSQVQMRLAVEQMVTYVLEPNVSLNVATTGENEY